MVQHMLELVVFVLACSGFTTMAMHRHDYPIVNVAIEEPSDVVEKKILMMGQRTASCHLHVKYRC